MRPFRIQLLPRVFLTWKSVRLSWNSLFIGNSYPLPTCPSLPLPWGPASALWVQPMGDISRRKKRKRRGMYPPAPSLLSMVWQWPCSSADGCSSCPVTLCHSRSAPQDLCCPFSAPTGPGRWQPHSCWPLGTSPSLLGSLKVVHTFVNTPPPQMPLCGAL